MAKVRNRTILFEAQIFRGYWIDYESEVLSQLMTVSMWTGKGIPFVCGAKDLGEAPSYRWRSYDSHKREPGTGDIVQKPFAICAVAMSEIRRIQNLYWERWTLWLQRTCKFLLNWSNTSTNMEELPVVLRSWRCCNTSRCCADGAIGGEGVFCRFQVFSSQEIC